MTLTNKKKFSILQFTLKWVWFCSCCCSTIISEKPDCFKQSKFQLMKEMIHSSFGFWKIPCISKRFSYLMSQAHKSFVWNKSQPVDTLHYLFSYSISALYIVRFFFLKFLVCLFVLTRHILLLLWEIALYLTKKTIVRSMFLIRNTNSKPKKFKCRIRV